MSRTKKDRPAWVRESDPAATTVHHNCIPGIRECDLDSVSGRPVPGHHVWCYRTESNRRYYDGPPSWFINHRWTAFDRLRVRVACDRYRDEFNSYGETDVLVPVDQHRQGATYDWY